MCPGYSEGSETAVAIGRSDLREFQSASCLVKRSISCSEVKISQSFIYLRPFSEIQIQPQG
jgi:hypothetical protein